MKKTSIAAELNTPTIRQLQENLADLDNQRGLIAAHIARLQKERNDHLDEVLTKTFDGLHLTTDADFDHLDEFLELYRTHVEDDEKK